jgi:hypothetical protein
VGTDFSKVEESDMINPNHILGNSKILAPYDVVFYNRCRRRYYPTLRQVMPVMGFDDRSQRPRGLMRGCIRPLASGIAGPNPTGCMEVSLL